jgi:hypothetical protein
MKLGVSLLCVKLILILREKVNLAWSGSFVDYRQDTKEGNAKCCALASVESFSTFYVY